MTEDSATEQFKKVKFQLATIISEMAGYKGRSTNTSLISAFFYLKDEYSQEELKDITNLSLGTISKYLKLGVKTGFVHKTKKKDPKTNKTKSYYSANGNFLEDFQKLRDRGTILETKIQEKLEIIKQKLNSSELKNKKGFSEMKEFCMNMENYLKHQPNLNRKQEEKNFRSPEFSSEIIVLEKEFVDFLADGLIAYGNRDPIFAKTIGYFFTRQVLTQKKLKQLTGLSAGAISKILNFFLEIGLIYKTEEPIKGTHEFQYVMNGISFETEEYRKRFKSKFSYFLGQLKDISGILEKNEELMKNFEGYSKVILLTQQLQLVVGGTLAKWE